MKNILIIKPFNLTFFVTWLILIVIFILIRRYVIKRGEKCAKMAIVIMSAVTLAIFIVYKFLLSKDAAYSEILVSAGLLPFNIFNELPFHLCNINIFVVPIAVITGKRSLKSFAFFLAPLGALMALLMPSIGFSDYSLFLPRIWGFYLTHMIIVLLGLSLYAFGLYRPRIKDTPGMVGALVVLSFCAFIVNVVFRTTGLSGTANYFYTYDPEGNPILEILFRFIPIRYVYALPCILILVLYVFLVFSILELQNKVIKRGILNPK